MSIKDKQLEDLLRRCTPYPWTLSMNDRDEFEMLASPDAMQSKVCFRIGPEVSGYDKRLWALAPQLAAEVLELRKQLRKAYNLI